MHKLTKEIVLIYVLTSIIVVYPDFDLTLIFYVKSLSLILLSFLFLILITNTNNNSFFYKKSGSILIMIFLFVLLYSILTLSGLNFLLFTIWFIIIFSFFGRYIGTSGLSLGKFSTITLMIVAIFLIRICLINFFPNLNYTYNIDYNFVELKNVGYNVGRTGWAISLILYICFLKGFKKLLATGSYFKKILIDIVILLSGFCVFLSDSRTGIVALILLVIIWNTVFLQKYIKIKVFLFLILVLEFIIILSSSTLITMLSENTRLSTFSSAEDISNGRSDGVLIGIDIIKNNLIVGTYPFKPYNLIDYGLNYPEIHIVWLNLMALYGVPLVIIIFFLIITYIYRGLNLFYFNIKKYKIIDFWTLIFLTFFGILVTFIEPNGIISFVSFSSIYWFSIGTFFTNREDILR